MELGIAVMKKGCLLLGHVKRMSKAAVRDSCLTESYVHRRTERSKLRWLYCVTDDLANIGVRNHRKRAKDRTEWSSSGRYSTKKNATLDN
jgi:hypothetical protein